MKPVTKVVLGSLIWLLSTGVLFTEAGEWKKSPFKDAYGNDQYEFKDDDGYKIKINKNPEKGLEEYKIKDNEGNSGVFKRKPFNDSNGNPVYEDTFTGKKKTEAEEIELPVREFESSLTETLIEQGYSLPSADPIIIQPKDEVRNKPLRGKETKIGRLDLNSDAKIDRSYSFNQTTLGFKAESDNQLIAFRYLKPLLEQKGWTVNGKATHYDLITMPLFKKNDNFKGSGDSYLTMNLYFFRNDEPNNDDPVIDAFVAKRITSDNMEKEIEAMCYEIIKKIPHVKGKADSSKKAPSEKYAEVGFIPDKAEGDKNEH